jgi:hypothetical protein
MVHNILESTTGITFFNSGFKINSGFKSDPSYFLL